MIVVAEVYYLINFILQSISSDFCADWYFTPRHTKMADTADAPFRKRKIEEAEGGLGKLTTILLSVLLQDLPIESEH